MKLSKIILILAAFVFMQSSDLRAQARRSSAPFISGDTFRNFCDFIIDDGPEGAFNAFDPLKVAKGDTIFVKTDFLQEFFQYHHPRIKSRYILITHNSDYAIPGRFYNYLNDPKLIAWFGENTDRMDHPKLITLPVGIANRYWPHGNIEILQNVISTVALLDQRSSRAYLNFTVGTNPKERHAVWELLKHKSFCFVQSGRSYEQFLKEAANCKFVISPLGSGLDCHRTWEALYLGCIPVVPRSTIISIFEDLPVIIIDDWQQVTEEFLQDQYKELKNKTFNMQKIYIDYWLDLIRSYQKSPN